MDVWVRLFVALAISMITLSGLTCAKTVQVQDEDDQVERLAKALVELLGEKDELKTEKRSFFGSDCGGNLDASSQVELLSSPRESDGKYEGWTDCEWVISAPQGQLEDRFSSIFPCPDKVRIFDGANSWAKHLGDFCGHSVPPDVTSSGNQLFVEFSTDFFNQERGFDAEYSAIYGSGGDTCIIQNTTTGGYLTPVRSGNYKPNMLCKWLITAPPGKLIKFTFDSFDLESDVGSVCFDSVDIRDGSSLLSAALLIHCGSSLPSAVQTTSNTGFVEFVSDDSVELQGFRLNFTFIDNDPTTCGERITRVTGKPQGTLTSYGYNAGAYWNGEHCRWRIEAPDNYVIRISFNTFFLETECYDWLRIYDGHDEMAPFLGQPYYCGTPSNELPADVESSTNYVFLVFHSDSSVTARGFSLTYAARSVPIPSTTPAPVAIAPECGQNSLRHMFEEPYKRIAGGKPSPQGKWPWQVLILVNGLWNAQCGGSLFHKQWVITAAHCLENETRQERVGPNEVALIDLYFGEQSLTQLQNKHDKRVASAIFFHPKRIDFGFKNDMAIIKLDKPVTLSDYVNVVCLPPSNSATAPGANCTVSGWGKEHHTNSEGSLELMHVDQTIIRNQDCKNKWDDVENIITDDNICTLTKNQLRSTCSGDSGGPLVCGRGDQYDLVGVVSWGSPCGLNHEPLPSVYARVQTSLDWINSVVGSNP